MNINYIKIKVINEINVRHKFIYKGNRNQIESFVGYIYKCYSRVFLVKQLNNQIKCFGYVDVIIGNLEMID